MPLAIGVLVPFRPGDPGRPEDLPLGRAALRLADEGIDVLLGHQAQDGVLIGHRAVPGAWRPARDRVVAAYCRYPSQSDPDGYARLVAELPVPIHNPIAPTLLCRDKLACQRHLEAHGVAQPEVEDDPARFTAALARWGAAYLKPRFGAFGRGVRRVTPGDPLPERGEGAVAGVEEPLLLQRAIAPPVGWAGVSARVLVQRVRRDWHVELPVARRSRTDPVVNAARGAEVVPAERVTDLERLRELALDTANALSHAEDGEALIELGIDLVIDRERRPWVVEVNSRPRGRLASLATSDPGFAAAHVEACARPLRWLAERYGQRLSSPRR